MPTAFTILLIPLLPLLCFALLGLWQHPLIKKMAGHLAAAVMFAVTVLALVVAYRYFFETGAAGEGYAKLEPLRFTWLQFAPGLSIDMSIVLDPLSVMMLVVVSFISFMVHLFSIAYMKGATRYATYFAFLSLFSFSMLGLVMAGNLLQVYIFWELVGVSSFLLIGFYYNRPAAVAAAKKAFIVTRFADLGFLVGILVLGFYGETLDIVTLLQRLTAPGSSSFLAASSVSFMGISALAWGLALVFMGGAGKSALFPLHIWLPDAMEGPTPVSALIHAATMVVAGVYLVARLFPLFYTVPAVMDLVTAVGLSSAVIAALIACTQTDIKRVLAYSTMSQIGFMMASLGLSGYGGDAGAGYTAALFHLFTHAFFKSLLFLCAGVIIHFLHSNEIQDMGGLRRLLPLTHFVFLVACLAIAGIPPFAGFFSKEAILHAAWQANGAVYAIAVAASALTAFYMFRLYFSIFWRKENAAALSAPSPEKNSWIQLPLAILGLCTLLAGWIPFGNFVSNDGQVMSAHAAWSFALLPLGLSAAAIMTAAYLYKNENGRSASIAASLGGFYRFVKQKLFIDELYLLITRRLLFNGLGRPAAWVDRHFIDGSMNGAGRMAEKASRLLRGWQSGKVQAYALYFFAGALLLAIIFIYFWK